MNPEEAEKQVVRTAVSVVLTLAVVLAGCGGAIGSVDAARDHLRNEARGV